MGRSGIYGYIEYGKQTNFATALAAGAATRAFGMNQKVTSLSINENKIELGDLNNVAVQKFAFGRFEGSLGVEWTLSNPWWIDSITSLTSTAGVGPYTHTYDQDKVVNAYTVEVGFAAETANRVLQLQKVTAKSITISMTLNDLVSCKGDFQIGATPTTAGTTVDSSISTDDITTPYTFVQGTLENPSGTVLSEVQSAELTLNPNITNVYAPNSTDAQSAFKGKTVIGGRFSLAVKDNTWWNNVRARAEPSNNTLRLKFTNGSAGTAERTMQFTVTGLGLGELNIPMDQYELVTEEIPFSARTISTVAVNNTSTPP